MVIGLYPVKCDFHFNNCMSHKREISILLANLPLLYLALTHTVLVTVVQGSSMAPSINSVPGSRTWVLLLKIGKGNFLCGPRKGLELGDIVYFRTPLNPDVYAVKRVKAFEGDRVLVRDNSLTYRKIGVDTTDIEKSHIWVEGDNAFHSKDSNTFGPLSLGLVEAKAVCAIDFSRFPFFFKIPDGGREARI